MDWNDIFKDGNQGGNKEPGNDNVVKLPELPFDFNSKTIFIILSVLALFWASTGVYIVEPNEKGIVLRFGKHNRTTNPGMHWKFPRPIERVFTPDVTKIRREEMGFRIIDQGPPARYRDVPSESLMLTGDENIVDIDIVVQYKITSPTDYLFNIRDSRKAIRDAAEAAIREVIGSSKIDEVLTTGKFNIQNKTMVLIQAIIDKYNSGLRIEAVQLQDVHPPKEVIASFKDVASAREDKNRMINEAQGYRNAIIPEARGKVAVILNAAEAYKQEKINMAKGDVQKFTKMLKEYKKAKNITKTRIYIETLEEVLPRMKKVIVDGKGQAPLLPFLNINERKTK